jgi:hypothetical protein
LKELVLNLTYSTESLSEISRSAEFDKGPTILDSMERHDMMCEVNGIVGQLYGIDCDTMEYILDTFDIVRNSEEENYGSFITKERTIEYFYHYGGSQNE